MIPIRSFGGLGRARARRRPTRLGIALAALAVLAALVPALGAAELRFDDGAGERSFVLAEQPAASAAEHRTDPAAPVLYEVAAPHDLAHRRVVAGEVLVTADAAAAAAMAGEFATSAPLPTHVDGRWRLRVADPARALAVASALRARGIAADPGLRRARTLRLTPTDPLVAQQWHLGPSAAFGIDVEPAWDITEGAGVTVALIDDGLEVAHPDLAPNCPTIASGLHHDFIDADDDPTESAGDAHGTACGGLIAARDGDGIGGCGVAPRARLIGERLIAGSGGTDLDEADAFAWHADVVDVSSNSWGPADDGVTLDGPAAQAAAALDAAVASGRGGKGLVIVWAAGNGDRAGDNAEYDGYAASPDVIAVGATTVAGARAPYSERGACLTICAPSSDGSGRSGHAITTTTVDGYTTGFSGTSAAAPQVAGVCALVLAANPLLGWRDVREILMRTAVRVDVGDAGWFANAAGLRFHPAYGAGLVDARAAVVAAQGWVDLPPRQTWSVARTALALAIPDAAAAGASVAFAVGAPQPGHALRVEQALVHVVVRHPRRSDLEYWLTSPAGTRIRLAARRPADAVADLDWTFHDVQHWGELGAGTWTLTVADLAAGGVGTLDAATLTLAGTDDTPPVATDDAATTPEDTAIDLAVLGNDTDADGDALAVASVGVPAHGTASRNDDGTIHYVPAPDDDRPDAFTYVVADRFGATSTAIVRVTIVPTPDPPTVSITAPAAGAIFPAGTAAIAVTVAAADPDPGDTVTVTVADGATAVSSAPYSVPIDRAGAHRLIATATDSTARTATAEVVVFVAGAHPTIASTPSRLVASPTSTWTYAPTVRGDAGAATWTLLERPASFAAAFDPALGAIAWTPAAGDVGSDARFRIRVDDGIGIDEQEVLVRVDADDVGARGGRR